MSLYARKVDDSFGIYDGFNCEFINPEYLGITEKEIREYVKHNPFPKDKDYSLKECIGDLTGSSGSYIIPTKREKTADFIAEMIRALI